MAGPACLRDCLHATAFVAVQLPGLLRLCICPLHYLCGSGCFWAGSSHLFMVFCDDSASAQVALWQAEDHFGIARFASLVVFKY